MFKGLLGVHNILSWIILAVALFTLLNYFRGWFGQKEWGKKDSKISLYFIILLDIQLILGIVLYCFLSPTTYHIFNNINIVLKNDKLTFFSFIHPSLMLLAIVLVHIGRYRVKKQKTAHKKFREALLFFGIAYLIILIGLP